MRINIAFFAILLFFFLFLFIVYPVNGALTGNSDTIVHLAFFKHYTNVITHFLSGEPLGNSYYPDSGVHLFAEPYFGQYAVFMFYKLLGISDIVAQYSFIATIYALNGWAVYLLAFYLTENKIAGCLAGFSFAGSSFLIANMELYNATGAVFAILAILFWLKYFKEGDVRYIILTVCFGGLQVYWSGYIFLFQNITLLLIAIVNYKKIVNKKTIKQVSLAVPFYILIILPYLLGYILADRFDNAYNPALYNPEQVDAFSMHFIDLVRPLKDNLIYPHNVGWLNEPEGVMQIPYHANLGIALFIMSILGVMYLKKRALYLVGLFLLGLFLAMGPIVEIGEYQLFSPLYWFYEHTSLGKFYRIPGRAFIISVAALSLLAAYGAKFIDDNYKFGYLIVGSITIFILMENVPFRTNLSSDRQILNPHPVYTDTLKQTPPEKTVLLELPSSILSDPSPEKNGLSEFSREYWYAYWQTIHKNHTINGSSGYFPKTRIMNDSLIKNLGSIKHFRKLISQNGITHALYHKEMLLTESERKYHRILDTTRLAKKVYEDSSLILYNLKKDDSFTEN